MIELVICPMRNHDAPVQSLASESQSHDSVQIVRMEGAGCWSTAVFFGVLCLARRVGRGRAVEGASGGTFPARGCVFRRYRRGKWCWKCGSMTARILMSLMIFLVTVISRRGPPCFTSSRWLGAAIRFSPGRSGMGSRIPRGGRVCFSRPVTNFGCMLFRGHGSR
jgi:hypothetical protein